MCRIENVEEVFQLQPSLAIIKIDKQQRNDRGSNIRIKYISCSNSNPPPTIWHDERSTAHTAAKSILAFAVVE